MLKRRLHHHKKGNRKKRLLKILIALLIIGVLGYFFIGRPVLAINTQAHVVMASAKAVKDAVKENDMDKVKDRMATLNTDFKKLENESKKIYWLRYIPIAGAYVSDYKNGIEAGDNMIQAGLVTVDTIAPYADLIGFKKGTSSFTDKSADDRIQTAVLTLDKIVGKVDDIAIYVDTARQKVDKIDPHRYPGKYGERLGSLKTQFDTVATLFVEAKPFMKQLPSMLGTDNEKTYLVLFQNDKELRPTGGFLTAYAIFKIKNGKISAQRSEDIYSLDASIPFHPKAPREILAYHKGVSQLNIRDSNLSPDFVTSMDMFDELYQKSSQKVSYDGIIAVDTTVLVHTLEILGDTEAGGITFSAKIDKRCDCPQVIYELANQIDRPVNYIKENRKGLLGQLLYAIMQKALAFSPSQYWGKLSQTFIQDAQEKHILVYMKDPEEQKAIEAINWGGRIKKYDGDYLHINDTNFAGAKSNLFVSHTVTSDTIFESNGVVKRKITIDYKNPYKHSDCNLERGGLCLNATLRNWLRIYVPEGSKLTSFKGSETKVNTYDELGKTVFEGFMQVAPLGKATVVVEYELPKDLVDKSNYKLLIQKQPGTKGHEYIIMINGAKKEELPLAKDFEFSAQ